MKNKKELVTWSAKGQNREGNMSHKLYEALGQRIGMPGVRRFASYKIQLKIDSGTYRDEIVNIVLRKDRKIIAAIKCLDAKFRGEQNTEKIVEAIMPMYREYFGEECVICVCTSTEEVNRCAEEVAQNIARFQGGRQTADALEEHCGSELYDDYSDILSGSDEPGERERRQAVRNSLKRYKPKPVANEDDDFDF